MALVKETDVPAHTVVEDELMEIVGTTELTTMVILLLTGEAGVAHGKELVITHEITEPLANALVVKVGELVPAFTPFTRHW
jgi:hypothetical protein